jgi:hypothetical protein
LRSSARTQELMRRRMIQWRCPQASFSDSDADDDDEDRLKARSQLSKPSTPSKTKASTQEESEGTTTTFNVNGPESTKCDIPTCSACLFARATKRPWRGKTRRDADNDETPTTIGEVVSVEQLESPTPGLIAQMTGKLTTKRWKYAILCVDQRSRFGYVHLQKTSSAEETIKGKKAFEMYARQHGVTIKNNLADNGIFMANQWVEECKKQGQGLTFTGVNAHHQNGVAERKIRELQDMARTKSRLPDGVTTNLWPYAIQMTNKAINNAPSFQDDNRKTRVELLLRIPSTAGNHLDARYMYWTINFNPENRFTSGNCAAKWEYPATGLGMDKQDECRHDSERFLLRRTGRPKEQ